MSNRPTASDASRAEMLLRGEVVRLKQLIESTEESAAAVRCQAELLSVALEASIDLVFWYIDRERERNAGTPPVPTNSANPFGNLPGIPKGFK